MVCLPCRSWRSSRPGLLGSRCAQSGGLRSQHGAESLRRSRAFLGHSGKRESTVSDEEIRLIITEAEGTGVIEKGETDLIIGVMRIADRSASGLMTPRHEINIAKANETLAELHARFRATGRSRLPLRRGGPDDFVGVVHSRDLLHAVAEGFDPIELARPVSSVHDALPAMQVIERLKASRLRQLDPA